MKGIIKYFLIIIIILTLSGCSATEENSMASAMAPKNNKLDIVGIWSVEEFQILDENIYNEEDINKIRLKDIIIAEDKIVLGEKLYKDSKYKLKVVKDNYVLSYEAKYDLSKLEPNSKYIDVYSLMYQDNILGEIIYFGKGRAYFYYEGVLLSLKYKSEINYDYNFEEKKENEKSTQLSANDIAQGVLLGLKTPMIDEDGNYKRESYRTLWINTKKSEIQEVKEKDYIVIPRINGLWKIEPYAYEDKEKNIYYETFHCTSETISTSLPNGEITHSIGFYENMLKVNTGSIFYKKINYVGNDYMAIEEINNSKYITNSYKVLPIDSLNLNEGVVIGDIYGDNINKVYRTAYEDAYRSLEEDRREEVSKYLDYSNFTVIRNNGQWMLQGMISGLDGAKSVEYSLGIKSNERLTSYDTLYIPWKSLKSDMPFMVDAYMSPNGTTAIILNKEEILVYSMKSGKIGEEPLQKIPLKDGEKVIMAEWCEDDYVDRWGSVFKDEININE